MRALISARRIAGGQTQVITKVRPRHIHSETPPGTDDPRQHARQRRAHARRVVPRSRQFFHGTKRRRLNYTILAACPAEGAMDAAWPELPPATTGDCRRAYDSRSGGLAEETCAG